jgi:thymidylate synthase (FAD)
MAEVLPDVKLLDYPHDPLSVLYVAYRTCYSGLTPQEIRRRVDSGKITREKMLEFLERWLPTGHGSPKQQLNFTFGLSGMSRVTSHQFVRHHVGIVFDQQSQRYVEFKGADFPYVVPPTWVKAGIVDRYVAFMSEAAALYQQALEAGIPGEDARFVLPHSAATNIQFTVNFEELLHIADQRLCTRAQWEIRHIWAKARAEVGKVCPELKKFIQPKCGHFRLGYCDETIGDYQRCPLSRVRPHKSMVPNRPIASKLVSDDDEMAV